MTTNSTVVAKGQKVSPAPKKTKMRRGSGATKVHAALYLFPVPALVLFLFFFAIPTLQAFQYAATDWNGFSADFRNVGFDNFLKAATGDSLFTNAVVNNLKFMLVVVFAQTLLSLFLAVFLTKNTRTNILLRALYFFPTILSSVSVAFIWKFIYDPNFGLVNQGLQSMGLGNMTQGFLGDDQFAIYWVAITQVWFHTGQMIVVFVAGLQAIPAELYEAAEVDGASKWQQFKSVTWPLVAPAMAIVVAYTTIQSFKAFDLILGLAGNPPKGSLDILSTRIYTSFANSEFGYAAAQSVLFMLFIGAVTFAQRRVLRAVQKEG